MISIECVGENISSNENVISLAKDLCMHLQQLLRFVSQGRCARESLIQKKDIAMAQAEENPTSR